MSSAINWRSGAKAGALKAAGLPGDAGQGDWDAASMPLSVGEWSVVQLQPETTGDSWKSAVSGNWTTAADWSTGVAPTSSNDATIAVAGTYTVTISSAVAAKSLTINDANATVADSSGGTLSIATTLAVTAGTFSLGSESEIVGGTISTGPSGTFSVQGGALSGVTYEGSLTLTGLGVALTLTNGTTLTGTGGTGGGALSLTGVDDSVTMTGSVSLAGSTGAGTLSLTGIIDNVDVHGTLTGVGVIDDNTEQGSLSLYDTRTLSTGTLNIGGPGYAILELVDDTGNGATLTLGSQYVVNQSGGPAAFYLINADDELINQGTITASVGNGANFQLGNMGTIVNQGSIAVSNGASMTIGAASFTNSGSLSVSGSSSVLYLDGNWVNTGSITDTGATLQLGGTFTTAALDMVADSGGGTVVIAGLLNNSGTLAVGAGSRFGTLGLAGTISGGTISDAGGGLSVSNGTLSGVTYEGSLTLATQDADLTLSGTTLTGTGGTGAGMLSITGTEDNVTLTGGTSLAGSTGAGTLSLTGIMDNVSVHGSLTGVGVIDDNTEEDSLTLFDTRTLSTGTLNIGGSGYAILELVDDTGNGATLTLGSQYVVNESVGSSAEFYLMNADDELINQGTITASVGNGVNFQLGDTGKIVNRGSIVVSNGASMTIDSTSFTNSGSVTVSGSTSVLYLQSDWVNTGSISNIGAKLELGGTFTTAALDMITDSGGGRVVIEGLLNNSGTLAVGAGSQFGALGLAGTISGGTISDAGGGLSVSNGTLSGVTYEGSLTLADFADLTLMDGTTLTGAGGSGGGVLNITGTEDVVTMTGGVSFADSTGAGTLSVTGFRDNLIVFGSLTGLGVINDYTSEGLLIFYDTRTLSTGTLNIGGSVMFELVPRHRSFDSLAASG